MPDFSKMSNMRELDVNDSLKLREVRGLDKSLNSMTLIDMKKCTKLTAGFTKNILQGIEEVEGLGLHLSIQDFVGYAFRFSTEAFVNMEKLRLLQLSNVQLNGVYKHIPKKLMRLSWRGCQLKSIPDDFLNQENLVILDMQRSRLVQVWEGYKSLQKLKIINLGHSTFLQKSLDFSQVPNLEKLILEGCDKLSEIHPSIGHLKRLALVNLTGCKMLSSLPRDFYKSKSVETLLLNGCSQFRKVHEDLGEMISLRILETDYTAIRKVPLSIVGLKNLTRLSLQGVKRIRLPHSLHGLNSLRELNISWCDLADDAIPKDLGTLISLQGLDVSSNGFGTLRSLSGLSKLETLSLNCCFNLHTIPNLPTNLKFLHVRGCQALEKMPDFSEMSNMRELDVSDSLKLTEVTGLDKSLNSMIRIDMGRCTNLTVDFTTNILQGWTSCGFGGIFFHGNYVPDWFEFVRKGTKISFDIPPSDGRNFEGLTLFCLYSSCKRTDRPLPLAITVIKNTKCIKLQAYTVKEDRNRIFYKPKSHHIWQGQLSNDKLNLQGGDSVEVGIDFSSSTVNRIGVKLVWDKPMKENMHDLDKACYAFTQIQLGSVVRHNQGGDASSSSRSSSRRSSSHI
nr:disease resistance-like protein CSA1 isoform X2 [Malus domestica]